MVGAQQKLRQAAEIMLQRLLVEGNAGEPQKIVLEIVQVPRDRLAIEAGARIANLVIQIAACLDLKARQHRHHFAIRFNRRRQQRSPLSDSRPEIQRALCRPSLLQGMLPGSSPQHRSPAPAIRGGKNALRTQGKQHSPPARNTRMPMALTLVPFSRTMDAP